MAVSPSEVSTRTANLPLATKWRVSPGSPSWNTTSPLANRRRRAIERKRRRSSSGTRDSSGHSTRQLCQLGSEDSVDPAGRRRRTCTSGAKSAASVAGALRVAGRSAPFVLAPGLQREPPDAGHRAEDAEGGRDRLDQLVLRHGPSPYRTPDEIGRAHV